MEIKLLHLYDDVMNLYGEYANIAVLARCLRAMGHTVTVDTLSLYEEKNVDGYDFYYMGAGTERKQKLVLPQLLRYREPLRAAFDSGKVMLFTGNAFELLGARVTDAAGTAFDALGFAPFETVESNRRITGDVLARCEMLSDTLVGFMNKCSKTTGVESPLFALDMGFGNEAQRGMEGFVTNNCFGTHLSGPILVKNPHLLRKIASLLTGEECTVSDSNMEAAYHTTLAALQARLQAAT